MAIKQFYVSVVGREIIVPLSELPEFDSFSTSGNVKASIHLPSKSFRVLSYSPGRFKISFIVGDKKISSYFSFFRDHEIFLIPILSCNYHTGWDPSLHDRHPHPECCGADKNNNAFIHVTKMERILHNNNLPITWLIDSKTATLQKDFFKIGCKLYGDEIAYMPPSYSHFNPVNYNIEKTLEDTTELCRIGIDELEYIFNKKITSIGIDQFIGSVGTNFVDAAVALGMKGIWGVGFDHGSCDTSMYHYGCPWNFYRPDKRNFRIPGKNPNPIWMFQWTLRDLIYSVRIPGGASGSVMFSTDVDDVIASNVAKNQKDYYHRLLKDYMKNADKNRFLEFTIHQEDHDSWRMEGLDYYEYFFANLPKGITPVTMTEAAEWMNLKYPFPQNSYQTLVMNDVLTCQDSVVFPYPGIDKPADWKKEPESYPPHIFHYDENCMLIYEKDSITPLRYLNYSRCYPVKENDVYPAEKLPEIKVKKLVLENLADGRVSVDYDIFSEFDYEEYPLAFWVDSKPPRSVIKFPGGFVLFISLKQGRNSKTCEY